MVASGAASQNPSGRTATEPVSGKKTPSTGDSPAAANSSSSSSHHPPDTNDPVLLSIASKQATLVQQQITLTCYIPSSNVGAVIGRKGATIAQIQRQAQQVGTSNGPVRLSIVGHQIDSAGTLTPGGDPALEACTTTAELLPSPQQPQQLHQSTAQQVQAQAPSTPSAASSSVPYTYSELDWSSPNWTPVVIRADPCAALTAAQLLRDKIENLDDVVMDVPLGRAKHAAVVGRRGFVLANLSADTSVRIMVPRRELRHDVIQLEGDLDNVKICLERVLGITGDNAATKKGKGNSNNNNTGGSNGARQQPQDKGDDAASVILNVPTLPSQNKLRSVGRKTDTLIKKKKAGDSWDLIISGSSQENIQSAASILKKWSEENAKNSSNINNNNNNEAGEGSSNNANNSGTSARSRGRGRQQGRNNNQNKRNRGKGGNKNSEPPPSM